jgi:hypothetical protein
MGGGNEFGRECNVIRSRSKRNEMSTISELRRRTSSGSRRTWTRSCSRAKRSKLGREMGMIERRVGRQNMFRSRPLEKLQVE